MPGKTDSMAAAALPGDLLKLLKRQQFVPETNIPAYRLLDILATPEADVGDLIVRFRQMKEPAMRKALHDMAVVLKELEDRYLAEQSPTASAGVQETTAPSEKKKKKKIKQSDEKVMNLEALSEAPHVLVYSDGASKGNPGHSGIAYVIADTKATPLLEECTYIGNATNNVAEYEALLAAMSKALELGKTSASFFSDSELVVNQVLGRWKINKPELAEYRQKIHGLRKKFVKFSLAAIPREQNSRADHLATCAIKAARAGAAPDSPEGGSA